MTIKKNIKTLFEKLISNKKIEDLKIKGDLKNRFRKNKF